MDHFQYRCAGVFDLHGISFSKTALWRGTVAVTPEVRPGSCQSGEPVEFSNGTRQPVRIENVVSDCGCHDQVSCADQQATPAVAMGILIPQTVTRAFVQGASLHIVIVSETCDDASPSHPTAAIAWMWVQYPLSLGREAEAKGNARFEERNLTAPSRERGRRERWHGPSDIAPCGIGRRHCSPSIRIVPHKQPSVRTQRRSSRHPR